MFHVTNKDDLIQLSTWLLRNPSHAVSVKMLDSDGVGVPFDGSGAPYLSFWVVNGGVHSGGPHDFSVLKLDLPAATS